MLSDIIKFIHEIFVQTSITLLFGMAIASFALIRMVLLAKGNE